jgi:hypothetical protein
MRTLPPALLLFLAGCPYIGEKEWVDRIQDADGDGSISVRFGGPDCKDDNSDIKDCDTDEDGVLTVEAGGEDCDDRDASVFPGAFEICDGADQDCDGLVDELEDVESPPEWAADDDGDGFGDPEELVAACAVPDGYLPLELARDCNDGDPAVNPSAPERCDAVDWDCDGDPVANAVDLVAWYVDGDDDGFVPLDADLAAQSCERPARAGLLPEDAAEADCDDGNAAIRPGQLEVWYDGVDADCDSADDYDQDGDGDGFVVDCDDLDPTVGPSAPEVCDLVDNDCDSLVDDDDDSIDDPANRTPRYVDGDGDGFGDVASARSFCLNAVPAGYVNRGDDCNDAYASAFPGGTELCDGLDNDCNGVADDNAADRVIRWQDADGDGFGATGAPVLACSGTANTVPNDDDCDDADSATWPGALEVCGDNVRQDCSALSPFDCDGDGYDALADGGTDCDDGDDDVNPDAREVCDGVDNDCDARFDDQDPNVDLSTIADWFVDDDGDGFGDPSRLTIAQACAPRPGEAPNGLDCDDTEATANPEGREACDELDNDCDGLVDDDDDDRPIDPPTYWLDNDGDSFGNPVNPSATTCEPLGPEWVDNDLDCQPGLAAINPFALEICDGLDNNCDGLLDDADPAAALTQWFADLDGDGYGQSGDAVAACSQPAGRSLEGGDCDDFDDTRSPGATEVCDGGLDNDCDGLSDDADPELAGLVSWWPDLDADGFGDRGAVPILQCGALPGHVNNPGDCDDLSPTRSPAAQELCNAQDDDCDDLVDDDDGSLVNAPLWYADTDVDGFGADADFLRSCDPPVGYRASSGDCDDADDDVYPNAPERCNGADDDCDGSVDTTDDDLVDGFFVDLDGDGVGGPVGDPGCGAPPVGQVAVGGDCNDGDDTVSPQVAEICNGRDDDCDGLVDDADASIVYGADGVYRDADGDGYGDPADAVARCAPPAGYVSNALDCAPGDAARSPAAVEFCNGVDDDCDLVVDDAPAVGPLTYADVDTDGFGDATTFLVECTPTVGRVLVSGDCDDLAFGVNPAAPETCNGGVDDDCDGLDESTDPDAVKQSFYADIDGDLVGSTFLGVFCADPGFAATTTGDCNDGDPAIFPGATEQCDGNDSNCDGKSDAEDPLTVVSGERRYRDADGDGFFEIFGAEGCGFGFGYLSVPGNDCDDTRIATNPSAPEVCDRVDNDCDTLTDELDPSLTGAKAGWDDRDGDGAGDDGGGTIAPAVFCDDATHAEVGGDCDDTNAARAPGRPEVCNGGVDDDCDSVADDLDPNLTSTTFGFLDGDGDGVGLNGTFGPYCVGRVAVAGDCDDKAASVKPGAPEVCNSGVDDDCDGLADDQDPSRTGGTQVLALDEDGDGTGGTVLQAFCEPGAPGYVGPVGDCDDQDAAIEPGAQELCNGGVDDDCDGFADDDDTIVTGTLPWQDDNDRDGYGAGTFFLRCEPLLGQLAAIYGGDCNDTNPGIRPGAVEVCNGLVDDDCDTFADDLDPSVVGASFADDLDGDGFGSGLPRYCTPGPLRASNTGDCDDTPGVGQHFFPGQVVTVPSVAPYVLGPDLQGAIDAVCDPAEIRVLDATVATTVDTRNKTLEIRGVSATARGRITSATAGTVFNQSTPGLSLRDLDIEGNGTNTVMRVTNTAVDFTRVQLRGGDAPGAFEGGGLRALNSQILGEGLELVDNLAQSGGGAFVSGGLFACVDCLFEDNVGTSSAGALQASNAQLMLANTQFVHNVGAGSLSVSGGIVTSTFEDLVFEDDDGISVSGPARFEGLLMTDSKNLTLSPANPDVVEFRGARLVRGGAPATATVVLQGGGVVLFEYNQLLGSYGGDLSTTSSSHTIRYNTFVDPFDTMIHLAAGTPVIESNVFFSTNQGTPTVNGAGVFTAVRHNAFARTALPSGVPPQNTADTSANWFQTYHPNLPAQQWDVHLRNGSPAIDAGDPALVDADGSSSDAGAFGGMRHAPFYFDAVFGDLDGDNLADAWELYWFGTTLVGPLEDHDLDFQRATDEFSDGTNPFLPDTDLDGCTDWDEFFGALDPLVCGGA